MILPLLKKTHPPTPAVPLLADSGYQGLHHRHASARIAYKAGKGSPLTDGLEKVKQILVGYQIGKSKGENVCIH